MRYVMIFFPWVGILIGLLEILAFALCRILGFGDIFRAAFLALVPIFVTGGIHMDGFMDTLDARNSWGDKEKKLEILKDPHTGAFAVFGCAAYLLLSFAAWSEVTEDMLPAAACIFFFSRCLSGLGVTTLRCAKTSGLAHTFHSAADKKTVRLVLAAETVIGTALILLLDPLPVAAAILAGWIVFAYYRRLAYRDFGGINGDLAGYFLQLCELAQLLVLVLVPRISEWIV